MNEEQTRWLERRLTKRERDIEEIAGLIYKAADSGKRFRVSIEYLDSGEHRMFQDEADRTITVPSGPPKESG